MSSWGEHTIRGTLWLEAVGGKRVWITEPREQMIAPNSTREVKSVQ